MGVPEDDDLGFGKGGVQLLGCRRAELVAVGDDDAEPVQLDVGDLRQTRPKLPAIGVAVDRSHRRDALELGEQSGGADVAAVQDAVDSLERMEDFGPEQPVGIRDDAEPHAP